MSEEKGIPGKNQKADEPINADRSTANKPPTTDMEVHHHSHGHGHKKTWKSYFWEFIMLFLAVFCGFLAEYYLEHRIEKERGKQFVESFYEDLKTDTARLAFYENFDDTKLNVLKNLGDCYDTLSKNPQSTFCLLEVMKISNFNRPFKWTERTLHQLYNAGGFRLLKKVDADSIIAYQKAYNNFQDLQVTVFQEAQENIRATFNQLVNFNANKQMFKQEGARFVTEADNKYVTAPLLFSNDKVLLNKYFNELQLYYRVMYNHRGLLQSMKENQVSLIGYFKRKYHFK
jgi:hypothetical protein